METEHVLAPICASGGPLAWAGAWAAAPPRGVGRGEVARLLLGLLAGWLLGTAACTTPERAAAKSSFDYLGHNTFRWSSYEGLSLISHSPAGLPKIGTSGWFYHEGLQLVLAEDDARGRSGRVLPEQYVTLPGDHATVDLSTFAQDGRVTVTRRHCGMDYVRDLLETRRDGLVVVGHGRVKLVGDPDPGDVMTFGNVYFQQLQGRDLDEAKRRFFHAGARHPRLAIAYLQRLAEHAEDEGHTAVVAEAENYLERFELLEGLHRSTGEEPEDGDGEAAGENAFSIDGNGRPEAAGQQG